MSEELLSRVHAKQRGMTVKAATDETGLAGDVAWPGIVPLHLPEGANVAEFVREQLLKIGEDIGDPLAFWEQATNGEVALVFAALVRARMVAEAERELAGAASSP